MARDVDGLMERVTTYLDKHPGLLKNVGAGLALTGLVFIGRSVRMFSWFRHATDVPAGFVRGGVRLRGRVCSASEGNLILEHLPIISFRKRTGQLAEGEGGLRVCLAGVDLTHDGKVWLESQLHPGDLVWFRLYERQGETLHCSVIRPKEGSHCRHHGQITNCYPNYCREGDGKPPSIILAEKLLRQYWTCLRAEH